MAPARSIAVALLTFACCGLAAADQAPIKWLRANATFYGGADASGTMGGACGYGNLYSTGYGTRTAALSTVLFNDGASCGQCYKIACDRKRAIPEFCRPGVTVTITATNLCSGGGANMARCGICHTLISTQIPIACLQHVAAATSYTVHQPCHTIIFICPPPLNLCPPNNALPNENGGWCNLPRPHFDMAQPAWEKIGVYKGGIIPIMYQRVPCVKKGGVRFKIVGHDYFNLVTVINVAAAGSIKSMDVKSSDSNNWMPMARNWGANWHSLALLTKKKLSFRLTDTDGQTLVFDNIVLDGWQFGQTFASKLQFQ
uniref:Uncharacterized protein n=1 Tax=Avena sativa TaxID=4498 RepID=A0ACD5YSV9_AVESA